MEKEMAAHSSTLSWKIPWTEEPGRLQSMGLQRVGHDWATSLHIVDYVRLSFKWMAKSFSYTYINSFSDDFFILVNIDWVELPVRYSGSLLIDLFHI